MKNQEQTQAWRISFFITGIIALLYGLVFIFLGYMPRAQQIIVYTDANQVFWNFPVIISLPFSVPRLFDLAFIMAFSFLAIKLVNALKHRTSNKWKDNSGVVMIIVYSTTGFLLSSITNELKGPIAAFMLIALISALINCILFLILLFSNGDDDLPALIANCVGPSLLIIFGGALSLCLINGIILALELCLVLGLINIVIFFITIYLCMAIKEIYTKIMSTRLGLWLKG